MEDPQQTLFWNVMLALAITLGVLMLDYMGVISTPPTRWLRELIMNEMLP
jgi:hypothetical protein